MSEVIQIPVKYIDSNLELQETETYKPTFKIYPFTAYLKALIIDNASTYYSYLKTLSIWVCVLLSVYLFIVWFIPHLLEFCVQYFVLHQL